MRAYKVLTSIGTFRIKSIKIVLSILGRLFALFPPPRRSWNNTNIHPIKKILVIRPGGIGDAVFLLPILRNLISRGIEIDILCEQRNAGVFKSQEIFLNRVYCYDILHEFWRVLKSSYDVVIDTEQWHYLSADIAARIRSKCRIGFLTRLSRAKLMDITVGYNGDGHELENFCRLFAIVTGGVRFEADIAGSFIVPPEFQKWADLQVQGPSVALFIGASIPLRRFTHSQIIDIIKPLLERNITVQLIGGTDVIKAAKKVVQEIDDKRLKNYVGQISLGRSVALIEKSNVFVGPDSGLMHLACAVRTPVVAVFGPGQQSKWEPPSGPNKVFSLNLPCSPCTQFGYTNPTCQGAFTCMRDIPIERLSGFVFEKLHNIDKSH